MSRLLKDVFSWLWESWTLVLSTTRDTH